MNFNVWNIKEMLNIPSGSGSTKSSNWNNNQIDYSALSDSQFLFGSQFCPENSETLSAPLDFGAHVKHPKQTQQNSLDNEPTIFTKYQTKPNLFGGVAKDEGLFSLPLPVGKSKGLLKQFEEKRKRTTDNFDSETLCNDVSRLGESIHKLQTLVEKSEEHLSSQSQSILDSLETVAKTFLETARVQNDLIVKAVQDKGNIEQAILEIQKRLEANQAEFIEMTSNLKNLEVVVAQQSKDSQQLREKFGQLNVPDVLEELKRLISAPPVLRHVTDNTSQTSPSLAQSLDFTRQQKYSSEEPATCEAPAIPAVGNPSKDSQKPADFDVWNEGAKSDVLQKPMLIATRSRKGNGHGKDKTMQTNFKDRDITEAGPKNHGCRLPGHKVYSDRYPVSQKDSELNLNNFEASIKKVCPDYQAQSVFPGDRRKQSATEQKGKTLQGERKSKKQQPRKSCRNRVKKREQTPNKSRAYNYKYQSPKSPTSGSKGPLIVHRGLRNSTKPVHHVLGGTVLTDTTAKAVQRSLMQSTKSCSQENELSNNSPGDEQISWFSNLILENSESPQYKKPGKNLLYNLDFDSSEDDF